MDDKDLRRLIEDGEGETVEFKRGIPSAKDLAETVVCLANARGGKILLGVGDKGEILGCRDFDAEELKRAIFNGVAPPLVVEVEVVRLPEGSVLVVTVPRSPVLHATTAGKYLRRVGRACQPVSPYEIPAVLVQKGQLDYTSLVVSGADLDDLDPPEVQRLRRLVVERNPRSELVSLSDGDFLAALEMVRREGGRLRPTVAGILAAGRAAALRSFVPGARVTYLYSGADEINYEVREDLERPLVTTLDRLGELIEARNRLFTLPVGLMRLEISDFPVEAYREGILNALCHRDYTQPDPVYVRHRPDRLEIESPGGFPAGITPETILHHRPKHRNPVLARLLQRLGYVEQAGIGVDRMYRALLSSGKEPPEYVERGDAVLLILRDGVFDRNFALFATEASARGRPLTLDQLIILSYLKRHRRLDRATAAAICQRSEREASEILAEMDRLGLVERRGTGAGTTYLLPARLAHLAGEEAAYVRDRGLGAVKWREMVLEYVRAWGSITNEKCRDLCGLNFHQASRLLADLCRQGLLRREGRGRYTRYVLP